MEREWTGNPKRLSHADQAEIERLIRDGETFETTAAKVGCSEKSVQRYLASIGGLQSRGKPRSSRLLSREEREGSFAPLAGRGVDAGDRGASWEGSVDDLSRGRLERKP